MPGSPRSPYPSPGPPTLLSAGLGPVLASQRPPGTVAGTQGPARSKAQNQSPPTMWQDRDRGRDRRLRVWASPPRPPVAPASAWSSETRILDPGSRPGAAASAAGSSQRRKASSRLAPPPQAPSRPTRPDPAPPRARDSEFRTVPPPEVATPCSLHIGLKEKRAGPRAQTPRCQVLRERTPACSPCSSREGPASPLSMSQLLGRASLTSLVPCMERLLVNICPPRCKLQETGSCTRRILSLPEHRADAWEGHCARNEG